MARPLRIKYEGALYHITARGNEKKRIFREKADYGKFIDTLFKNKKRYGIILYGYVLMPNHYHLLIETPQANLSRFMHNLQTTYTIFFNLKYNRVGHLFQGRYKALLVDKDNYLIELIRYIHLNPVRAQIVDHPERYMWSSYREYVGTATNIDPDFVLSYFDKTRAKAIKEMKSFTIEGKLDRQTIKGKTYGQLIIGTKEFTQKIKQKIQNIKLNKEITGRRKLIPRKSIEAIIDKVTTNFDLSKKELMNKTGRWNEARKIAIYLVRNHTDTPLNILGNLFGGVHYTAISQICNRIRKKRKEDHKLDKMIHLIENKL